MRGTGAARLAAELRVDPALCGLALYKTPFHLLPGRDPLAGRSPLYAFHPADPLASGDLAATAQRAAPRTASFRGGTRQRICRPDFHNAIVPASMEPMCASSRETAAVTQRPRRPFVLNDVLVRVDR